MIKVPFNTLSPQVEAMYQVKFRDDQAKEIEEHCLNIQSLIENSGWSTEEYTQRWLYGELN
jgi:hypothetical protein